MLIICICTVANADKLMIPYDCYPRELQQRFLENGYKLELDSTLREADSWGFLENEGSQYNIYTYKPLTDKELQDILELTNGYKNNG